MYRRVIIFLLVGCLPSMAMAEKLSLAGISTYLQGLKTLEAQFTQINSDQSISTGRLYLHRPGRARFEYNPPDQALVIAGGGAVAIFDLKTGQLPDQFPLKRTPLWVVLEPNVNLQKSKMVLSHTEDGPATKVVAHDPKNPDLGQIELVFTQNPTQLRQWIITDGVGSKTTVILGDAVTGERLPASLFSIQLQRAELNNR
jgi:outer membrane lipoprotein-sorting protein